MPATSLKVTRCCSSGLTRRALVRPKPPRMPPPPAPAWRRAIQMKKPMMSSHGRKPRTSVQKTERPESGGLGVDRHARLGEDVGELAVIDERGDLRLELRHLERLVVAGRVVVGLVLELPLDRVALRADLADVLRLDLVEEERLIGDARAVGCAAGQEGDQEVHREQAEQERDPHPAARDHRRLRRRRGAAAVGRRVDAPAGGMGLRRRRLRRRGVLRGRGLCCRVGGQVPRCTPATARGLGATRDTNAAAVMEPARRSSPITTSYLPAELTGAPRRAGSVSLYVGIAGGRSASRRSPTATTSRAAARERRGRHRPRSPRSATSSRSMSRCSPTAARSSRCTSRLGSRAPRVRRSRRSSG